METIAFLLKSRQSVTTSTILKELNALEICCSDRTIRRDIQALRQDFGAVVIRGKNGYSLQNRFWEFKLSSVGEEESVLLTEHLAGAIYPPEMAGRIKASLLSSQGAVDCSEAFNETDPDAIVLDTCIDVKIDPDVFKIVWEAWSQQRSLCFQYNSPWSSSVKQCLLEPHVLGLVQGVWYAVGHWPDTRGDSHVFAIHRMSQAKARQTFFEPDRRLIKRCREQGVLFFEQTENVVLHCQETMAKYIRDRHPEWVVTQVNKATYEVRIERIQTEKLIDWVMRRRGAASLISPPDLRRHILQIATDVAAAHQILDGKEN